MHQITIWILPTILAFSGTVWGVLRLISARRRKSRFVRSSIEEQQKALKSEILKIRQLMYSPLSFIKSCGILFPLFVLISVFSGASRTFRIFALAGTRDFCLFASALEEALLAYAIVFIITLFAWAMYFFLNHASRKLILDMRCLAGSE